MQKSVIIIGIIVVLAIAAYAILGSQSQKNAETQISEIKWRTDLNSALLEAKKTNKSVFIDFYATWCSPCKLMEQNTYSNPEVIAKLNANYIPVKIDVDKNPQIVSEYKVYGYPTMVILNPNGIEIKRFSGYRDADTFLNEI